MRSSGAMVKIAFNSPFAQKDEPKKEGAEALVADKVRGAGSVRCRVAAGGAGAEGRRGAGRGGGAGGGGSRRHLLAEAAGRGNAAGSPRRRRLPPHRSLRRSPALGQPSSLGTAALPSALRGGGEGGGERVAPLRAAAMRGCRAGGRCGCERARARPAAAAVCGSLATAILPARLTGREAPGGAELRAGWRGRGRPGCLSGSWARARAVFPDGALNQGPVS